MPIKSPIHLTDEERLALGEWHPKKERLKLALWILGGLFFLYMLSIIVYVVDCNSAGAAIFEAAQKILPPIATLVIGYYFSRKK